MKFSYVFEAPIFGEKVNNGEICYTVVATQKYGYGLDGRLYRIINENPKVGEIVAEMVLKCNEIDCVCNYAVSEFDRFEKDPNDVYYASYEANWGGRNPQFAVRKFGEQKPVRWTGSNGFEGLKAAAKAAKSLNKLAKQGGYLLP